jgi:hypothetical protein
VVRPEHQGRRHGTASRRWRHKGTVVGAADPKRARAPVDGVGWVNDGHGGVARGEVLELADGGSSPPCTARRGAPPRR